MTPVPSIDPLLSSTPTPVGTLKSIETNNVPAAQLGQYKMAFELQIYAKACVPAAFSGSF